MRILFLRHGSAGDKIEFAKTGKPDGERPLDKKGRQQIKLFAKRLKTDEPDFELVLSSPFVRASESAQIFVKEYFKSKKTKKLKYTTLLQPDSDFQKLLDLLVRTRKEKIVIVGHEPDLSSFVCWNLVGKKKSFLKLRKGSGGIIEFNNRSTLLLRLWENF